MNIIRDEDDLYSMHNLRDDEHDARIIVIPK